MSFGLFFFILGPLIFYYPSSIHVNKTTVRDTVQTTHVCLEGLPSYPPLLSNVKSQEMYLVHKPDNRDSDSL